MSNHCCKRFNRGWIFQLIEGTRSVRRLPTYDGLTIAADRGYFSRDMIQFFTEDLQVDFLGTHKRAFEYPFKYGSGYVAERHPGVEVPLQCHKAAYWARNDTFSGSAGVIYACSYRENNWRKRVGNLITNMDVLGPGKWACLPKSRSKAAFRRRAEAGNYQHVCTSLKDLVSQAGVVLKDIERGVQFLTVEQLVSPQGISHHFETRCIVP